MAGAARFEASSGASRVLTKAVVSGRAGSVTSGPRLVLTLDNPAPSPGEPVFDEFGQVIGVVGGSLVPGATDLVDLIRFRAELRGVPLVPIGLVRVPPVATPVALADARAG